MLASLGRYCTLVLVGAVLASCSYSGGDIGNPLVRKSQWFSFAGGDDLRGACRADTPDRYRLIYNAIYDQQIRIYELDAVRQVLIIRVIEKANMAEISSDDLMAPWRAKEQRVQLDPPTYDRLVSAFAAGGMFGPPATGLELPSRSYYWLASFCRGGVFGLTGWKYPSPAFDAMQFDKMLFALDPAEVPVRQAGPIPFDPQWEDKARRLEVPVFSFRVTDHGLLR